MKNIISSMRNASLRFPVDTNKRGGEGVKRTHHALYQTIQHHQSTFPHCRIHSHGHPVHGLRPPQALSILKATGCTFSPLISSESAESRGVVLLEKSDHSTQALPRTCRKSTADKKKLTSVEYVAATSLPYELRR